MHYTHVLDSIEETIQSATDSAPHAEEGSPLQERLSAFVRLDELRRKLEDSLKVVADQVSALEPQIILDMSAAGMDSCRIGKTTVYMGVSHWVRKKPEKDGVTTDMVCEALRAIGRGDMVEDGYSASSLKSLVTEMLAEGGEVPDALNRLLDIGSKTKLSTQKRG